MGFPCFLAARHPNLILFHYVIFARLASAVAATVDCSVCKILHGSILFLDFVGSLFLPATWGHSPIQFAHAAVDD